MPKTSFFFIENRSFSHTLDPNHSSPHPPPLSTRSTPLLSPFRKKHASKRQQPNMTKQNTRRQGKSLCIEAVHDHPMGGRAPRAGQWNKDPLSSAEFPKFWREGPDGDL